MSNGSLDNLLMTAAWNRLWTPGTPYYLPDAMLNGVNQNGIIVTPYKTILIANIGPVPLYDSDVWGNISVTMTSCTVYGIAGVSQGTFTYNDTTKTFVASINFGALQFTGQYEADAGGVLGCAVNTAKFLLGGFSAAAVPERLGGEEADAGDTDPSIGLAQSYRDQLAAQPPTASGMTLVGTYYDNNDTLNEMVAGTVPGATVFNIFWPTATTTGLNQNGVMVTVTSADLCNQTTVSAQQPTNPATPVGYPAYSTHSYKMQGLMLNALMAAYNGTADPVLRQRYLDAANATLAFKNATVPDASTTTVASVMTTVATTPPPTDDPAVLAAMHVVHPCQEQIDRETQELIDEHARMSEEERAAAVRANALALGNPSQATVSGDFTDSINSASITLTGTVTISGIMPNLVLTVAITNIAGAIPPVNIQLSGSGGLLDDVSNYIANSSWFQKLLAQNIATQLNNTSLQSYLSDRLNQALAQVWGGT